MDKDSVLYLLMNMRVNGILDRILKKDEDGADDKAAAPASRTKENRFKPQSAKISDYFSAGYSSSAFESEIPPHTSLRLLFHVFLPMDYLYTPAYSEISSARKVISQAFRIFALQSCSNCNPAYGPHPLNSFS